MGELLWDCCDLRVEGIARHERQAVHLDGEAAGKGAQEALRNLSHTGGPAPHTFFVFMKAFAERRMGVRYLDPQMIVAQDELLHADAEAPPVGRQQAQLGRDPATRGEPYLVRHRVEPEDVVAIGNRLRCHDAPIDDQMEVGVGGGPMAERRRPIEYRARITASSAIPASSRGRQ